MKKEETPEKKPKNSQKTPKKEKQTFHLPE